MALSQNRLHSARALLRSTFASDGAKSPASARVLGWVPLLLLLTTVVTIAAALEHFASPPGGLQLAAPNKGDGNPEVRTGNEQYPREALDGDNFRVKVPAPAKRIVSQALPIDEFLYSVVQPEKVVAVSPSAPMPDSTPIAAIVERYHPAIISNTEQVLRMNPDLILVSSTGRADFTTLARQSGIPVYRMFTMFTTIEQVAETIRLTGYLTGADDNAKREETRFRNEIEKSLSLRPADSPRLRVLGVSGKLSYGSDTLLSDIIEKIGGINVAAEGGLKGYGEVNSETILRWNPDWIVTGADSGHVGEVRAKLMSDPAIALTNAARNGHILVMENRLFFPVSPYCSALMKTMAEAFYGKANNNDVVAMGAR